MLQTQLSGDGKEIYDTKAQARKTQQHKRKTVHKHTIHIVSMQ